MYKLHKISRQLSSIYVKSKLIDYKSKYDIIAAK